ncbi:MAG: tetratricopeptide repeat protein [Desulfobaccales bacterium]
MKEMTAQEFVRRLKNLLDGTDNRFIFFLGAGCSISSGIPAAGPLTKNWLIRLKKLQTGNDENFDPWVKDLFADYSDENAALFYGKTIEKLFLTPDERQKEIERLTENRDPGFGYVILAQLLSQGTYGRCCNTILTTNFDDLVADGLYLYNNKKPLVIVHDSLVSFVKVTITRPLVIKLHGDDRLAPRNTETETHELNEAVQRVLKLLLAETGIIFIGYGGNDQSINSVLDSLDDYALPGGVYWVGSSGPVNEMGEWLKKRNAIWVNHRDFDELMLLILNEFELDHPNEIRFKRLLDGYFETFKKLETLVKAKPESDEKKVIEEAAEKAAKKFKDWRAVALEANKYAKSDLKRAEEIYREGLLKFPDNSNLLTAFAFFLQNSRNDYVTADEYYKKSLEIDPNNSISLSSYATFLRKNRNDYRKALEYYHKAIAIDPDNPSILTNYAILMKDNIKDNASAEAIYRKILNVNPNYANNLGNLGGLLLSKGNYSEGMPLLERAIELGGSTALLLECLFYQYAHDLDKTTRAESLAKIKDLIQSGARSPGWNLEDNVKRAIEDGHPQPEFLKTLAKVISEEADAAQLEKYDEWTKN